MQFSDVFSQSFHVSYTMDKRIFHMRAYRARGLRYEQDAPAAPCFCGYEGTSFLDAGKNQDIAFPHQFRDVVPMPEDTDAWVRKHGSELLGICR